MNSVTLLVLAGGQGSRMNGADKGLVQYKGEALVDRLVKRLSKGVDAVLVSANRNLEAYTNKGYTVVTDAQVKREGFQGPLVGVLAALSQIQTDWLLVVPCDCPNVPENLLERLSEGKAISQCISVKAADLPQPTMMLIHRNLKFSLEQYLNSGERRVRGFLESNQVKWINFNEIQGFENLNTVTDLKELENSSQIA